LSLPTSLPLSLPSQNSSEGDSFELSAAVARQSELINVMLDTDEGSEETQDIPLPNVKTEVLTKVIAFMKENAVNPMTPIEKPLKSSNMSEVVQVFYSDFVAVEQDLLFELILAANYVRHTKAALKSTCFKHLTLFLSLSLTLCRWTSSLSSTSPAPPLRQ
jgi:S-phase kinase-associated protein 1